MNATEKQIDQEMRDEMEADINVPWIYRWSRITHYYGDVVRQLLIAAAVMLLIGAPFYSNDLPAELPFIVLGTVALVCVAALTNPWKTTVISADAVASGVGLVIFEMWALLNYQSDPLHQFILREAIALMFFFSLYFSTKTLRSMLLGQVGKHDSSREFRPEAEKTMTEEEKTKMDWREEAREVIQEKNEQSKFEYSD